MIKDFLEKNYCPKNCDELTQKECHEGVRIRCSDFEEREKLLEDFAEQENNRLAQQIAEFKKIFADCDTCKRTCDIGNCCKFGSEYIPDIEKIHKKDKQSIQAKEIIKKLLTVDYPSTTLEECKAINQQARQFLKE